jgi:hypothetical protein
MLWWLFFFGEKKVCFVKILGGAMRGERRGGKVFVEVKIVVGRVSLIKKKKIKNIKINN